MNGEDKKKIQFSTTFKTYADFRIRLQYDDLKVREFFGAVLDGYINGDSCLQTFIDETKEKKQAAKTKRQKIYKSQKRSKEIKNQFALSDGEIENIFDIIEKENPDL